MTDIPPINVAATLGINLVEREKGFGAVHGHSDAGVVDQVEISDLAQRLSALGSASGIRTEKVAAVRDAIAAGTYETPDKIEYTIDRLMGVLGYE